MCCDLRLQRGRAHCTKDAFVCTFLTSCALGITTGSHMCLDVAGSCRKNSLGVLQVMYRIHASRGSAVWGRRHQGLMMHVGVWGCLRKE